MGDGPPFSTELICKSKQRYEYTRTGEDTWQMSSSRSVIHQCGKDAYMALVHGKASLVTSRDGRLTFRCQPKS